MAAKRKRAIRGSKSTRRSRRPTSRFRSGAEPRLTEAAARGDYDPHDAGEKPRRGRNNDSEWWGVQQPAHEQAAADGRRRAGGGATLIVAEKAGLSPAWAGAATGGLAFSGSALFPNPMLKDAFFAAGLGGMGSPVSNCSRGCRQAEVRTMRRRDAPKRQADGDSPQPYVTRTELNAALAQLADKTTTATSRRATS